MPLLADYAITPDVFDATSYSSEEIGRLYLREISRVVRSEGLVRDLRSGKWRELFAEDKRPWHRTGKELVRKLVAQGRLVGSQPALSTDPVSDENWCAEALATHQTQPLMGGIIVTGPVKDTYQSEALVERIDQLDRASWWDPINPSVRLTRSLADYQRQLGPILRCANSLHFIDPHLDPTEDHYEEFGDLLVCAGKRRPAPLIEIHRVCYKGSGPNRTILKVNELERDFRRELGGALQSAGIQADVFIWDHFHDRYLISNLVGILLPNGFDTSHNPKDLTTWTRLGRRERDDIQREFEEASGRHKLYGRFSIP